MITYREILEKEYAEFAGTKYAVAVNSGTSALHLSLVALGIGKGDEVIVPDFTMVACGYAVAYTGAKVVTVDCGDDLNIDVSKIEEKITDKTRAIMAVHIYGRLCDMKTIAKIAKKYNLFVIEDGCEAQGATDSKYSDISCFSFYKNKIIHAEEGGIICTNNKMIADKIAYLKNMAFSKSHDYYHTDIGYNYRIPESQAKMALDSLRNYHNEDIRRRKIEKNFYGDLNEKHDAVWVLDILCKDENERDKLVSTIPNTRYFFKPLSTMPMFKQKVGKNALRVSKLGMYYCIDN